jgi:hypothetical protein
MRPINSIKVALTWIAITAIKIVALIAIHQICKVGIIKTIWCTMSHLLITLYISAKMNMIFSKCLTINRIFRNNSERKSMCPISNSSMLQTINFCNLPWENLTELGSTEGLLLVAQKVRIHSRRIFSRRNKMEMMRILFNKLMLLWMNRMNLMRFSLILVQLCFQIMIIGLYKVI